MKGQGKTRVQRRRVFYVPGYDPFPPRRYRELYRKEGRDQAAISGYDIQLLARHETTDFGWFVKARFDDVEVCAEVDVLVWSDLVQDSMTGGITKTYQNLLRTAWTYVATGTLRRLMWMRKGPVIAALYPVAMLLLQMALAIGAGVFVFSMVSALLPGVPVGPVLAVIPAVAVFAFVMRGFRRLDGRLYAYYLMHDYAFAASRKGAYPDILEQRLHAFQTRITAALDEDWDEVLIVGHSSGAHLAVSVLADLIRSRKGKVGGPELALLTLGQVVPMQSFLPEADRLRADLKDLATSAALTWVDVSAPGDGCSFALCDPVAVSGVAPEGRTWPLVLSAAFSQTLSPARWKSLRWRFFRLHFQYLCAFDRPGDYDYFRITAGPMTLADRFAGRSPSASRIDVPASKYTSVRAA